MTTDLEHDIRDALRDRAQSLTAQDLRYPDAPRGRTIHRRTRLWAGVAAAACIALIAGAVAVIASTGSHPDGPSDRWSVPAGGAHWRLIRVDGPLGSIAITPDVRADVRFQSNGEVIGNDGANALGATYRESASGFTITPGGTTLVGDFATEPVRVAARDGIDALLGGRGTGDIDVVAQISGRQLTLRVPEYTLVFAYAGRAPIPPTPSPTSTRS